MINVTGLWLNESKDGSKYMTGIFCNGLRVLIFKNTKKRPGSKDPDYRLCLAPDQPQKEQQQQPKENKEEDLPF